MRQPDPDRPASLTGHSTPEPAARRGAARRGEPVPEAAIGRLLDAVTDLAAPRSRIGFDIINGQVLTSPWTRPWVDMQAAAGAPWIGTMDDPVRFLVERGWQATLTQAGQPDANHGRWQLPVIPTDMPDMPHNWYVTARKAEGTTWVRPGFSHGHP